MIEKFYERLAIPETCFLGSRLPKKLLYEKVKLSANDKKAIADTIDSIHVQYTLRPDTINIPRYEDADIEYHEIAVIQVILRKPNHYKRIGEIIQRAIPYPLLIVFFCGETLALQVALKRKNKADSEQLMVETFHDTNWMPHSDPTPLQSEFLKHFVVTQFSYANCWAFYCDLVNRIVALNCGEFSGKYTLESGSTGASRIETLNEIRKLRAEQVKTRNALDKETQFNRKVDLNMKLKNLEQAINACMNRI